MVLTSNCPEGRLDRRKARADERDPLAAAQNLQPLQAANATRLAIASTV
jgi:hypothetical protein